MRLTNRTEHGASTWRLMGVWLSRIVALTLLVTPALAAAQAALTLDDVSYTSLPGDRVVVKLRLSAPLKQDPLSFTIDNPARLALDFPGIKLNLPKKTTEIGVGAAQSVTAVEAPDRTRVVVNMARMVPYQIGVEGNDVVISLQGAAPALADKAAVQAAQATMPGSAQGASIQDIDFRRGEKGEGRVIVRLSDPNVGVNIEEVGGKIVVDFINTRLPKNLDRKLDVLDFATPVKEIDAKSKGNGARMVITPAGSFEHLAYQSDNLLTVELKPLTPEEAEQRKKDKLGFTGERLSLNFQNIEVRAVLQLIADFTSLNLVASDTVTGNVTLRLKNVPWDQALDIILKSKGLAMRQAGNVIMVAPTEEIAAREKLELESQKQISELAPLKTEFIQVNYAKAKDIAALLKSQANKLLSERGNVTLDDRTNTLLVQDTAEKLAEIRRVTERLDVPVRQVLIESRIVIADTTFAKELGVRFGYSKHTSQKAQAAGDLFAAIGGGRDGKVDYNAPTAFVSQEGNENYIVDLPVVNPAGALQLAVGRIGSYLLQLELSALQTEGRGEVISSPRVITANQKKAVIEQGTEIPYQEATSSGATSVSFKKAVLSLEVTPQITPDDRIIMDIKVNKDSVGQVFNNVPSIDTREVETQVLVDNGETVILGGIYEATTREDLRKVPFFGELPYLGWLFKTKQNQNDQVELLIFVTPKLLKENVALQ